MKRWHLFEWEDQPWLPSVFRDFITDHLHTFMRQEDLFAPAVPLIADALKATGQRHLIDLCSGGGGPYPRMVESLSKAMGEPVTATLTDLFPNRQAAARLEKQPECGVQFRREATSAFDVPRELAGMRTMFTSLHHFQPQDVRKMLAGAVASGQAFGAFEITQRDFFTLAAIGVFSFFRGLLATHQVGPMTAARFLTTYIVPIAPMVYAWDGMVSCLRSYTPEELMEFTKEFADSGYSWKAGDLDGAHSYGQYRVTYLVGTPPGKELQVKAAA
jgi:hypothetical protein